MMQVVSVRKANSYNYDEVRAAIADNIKDLGGLDKYISRGEKVLLKLNLLMKKHPDEAATTHPVFVKALASLLLEHGCRVIIGDSPGGPFNPSMLKGVYKACGIEAIASEIDVKLNYNTNSCEVKNEGGLILKKITAIEVIKEVDKVISVSKLKTHGMMLFTGAVKNMFGVVAGLEKAEYHVRMPKNTDFSNALVDICMAAKPALSFMDGIIGMEGAGPSAGNPREIGVCIASESPYHLDLVATNIVGINPTKVPTIQRCIERGILKGNLEDISIRGEKLDSLRIKDFIVPEIRNLNLLEGKLPKFMKDILNGMMQPKPVFNHEACVGCSDCAKNCPPRVINMTNNKPEVKIEECIRCFCCQELCPVKAVEIHRPLLMKLMAKM